MSKISQFNKITPYNENDLVSLHENQISYCGNNGYLITINSDGSILASVKPLCGDLKILGNVSEIPENVIDELKTSKVELACLIASWISNYLPETCTTNQHLSHLDTWLAKTETKQDKNTTSNSTILKRGNNFVIEFPDELCLKSWVVESAQRPSIEIYTEKVCNNPSGKKHFVVTGYNWNPITFTLIDPIGPSSSQCLMEWVRMSVNSIKDEICEVPEYYTKDIKLKMLDQTGTAVEQWELNGCVLNSVDFGILDYNDGKKLKITFTVQPSYCVLLY